MVTEDFDYTPWYAQPWSAFGADQVVCPRCASLLPAGLEKPHVQWHSRYER